MAADFTSYTIKALNKVPTVLSRSEKDLLLFRNLTELLTGRTALLRMSKVWFLRMQTKIFVNYIVKCKHILKQHVVYDKQTQF